MTHPSKLIGKPAKTFARCVLCGRLGEKRNMIRRPVGLVGKDCSAKLDRELARQAGDPHDG